MHFEYDGASTMFLKVFDEEGCRLECCPGGGRRDVTAAGAGPATGLVGSSSDSSEGAWESGDSPEPFETLETSDDSYVPRALAVPGAQRRLSPVAAADLDGVGVGLPWATVDDGIGGDACR